MISSNALSYSISDCCQTGELVDASKSLYGPINFLPVDGAERVFLTVGRIGTPIQNEYVRQLAVKSGFRVQPFCGVNNSRVPSSESTTILLSKWPIGRTYHAAMSEEILGSK